MTYILELFELDENNKTLSKSRLYKEFKSLGLRHVQISQDYAWIILKFKYKEDMNLYKIAGDIKIFGEDLDELRKNRIVPVPFGAIYRHR